jgi:hypothetical protein
LGYTPSLFGYGPEHRPPTDDAGCLEFLASVAPADVLAGIIAADPSTTWRLMPSRRAEGVDMSDSRGSRTDCSRSAMR